MVCVGKVLQCMRLTFLDWAGVSDPYATKMAKTKAELKAKIQQLNQVALKTKLPGQRQKLAAVTQHLAVYSETEEVAKILKDMLSDIEARLKIIDTVDEQAKKLVEDTEAKMVEWEKKLVVLANEADKAKEKMMAEKLERGKLNGAKAFGRPRPPAGVGGAAPPA